VKISGERFESSYWLNRTVWRDGHEHLFSSNINAGRVRVQYRQHADTARTFVFSLLTLRHVGLLLPEPAARGYDASKLLNEIAETASSLTCT
jgi:hypothetical protein